jgi:hypothetical protein
MGRAMITSEITRESADLCFGVLRGGDRTINCGVRTYQGEKTYQAMRREISRSFGKGALPKTIRLMNSHFGSSLYSLKSLFRDEQRKILNLIMESTVQDAEKEYRRLYEHHAPMMRLLKELKIPAPKAIYSAAEVAINAGLRRAFKEKRFDPEQVEDLLKEAGETGIALDADTLEFVFRETIEHMAERLADDPSDLSLIKRLEAAVGLAGSLPFQVNLWRTQNIFYEILQKVYEAFRHKADQGGKKAVEWLKHLRRLGDKLYVRVE